jgi:hypothetical protein
MKWFPMSNKLSNFASASPITLYHTFEMGQDQMALLSNSKW